MECSVAVAAYKLIHFAVSTSISLLVLIDVACRARFGMEQTVAGAEAADVVGPVVFVALPLNCSAHFRLVAGCGRALR